MRDYGRVFSTFWTSEDTRALSDDGKLLALYLLTGPHGTLAGVFRLPDGYVIEDVHWTAGRVSKGFGELFRHGFANRCETTNWVWINKFLAWNTPENPNQWKAARKIAAQVPAQCAWKAEFSRAFAMFAGDEPTIKTNGSGTVSKGFPSGSGSGTVSGTGTEGEARSRSPATHLPTDFRLTDDRKTIAILEHLDPDRTFAKFQNYWRAASGAKARKRDWDAAWQSWCLTETDHRGNGHKPRKTRFEEVTEHLREK